MQSGWFWDAESFIGISESENWKVSRKSEAES